MIVHSAHPHKSFLSTLSLRRATKVSVIVPSGSLYFYPRSPCGERRKWWRTFLHPRSYFYPRSPCGERRHLSCNEWYHIPISIHALLAESDEDQNCASSSGPLFLSTLSLRRATTDGHAFHVPLFPFLSTLSLRRATGLVNAFHGDLLTFLSTLSLRRATAGAAGADRDKRISIHALLAESDGNVLDWIKQRFDFYPRSPCGERPDGLGGKCHHIPNFYPRSPCGERHAQHFSTLHNILISIHALLAESDYTHPVTIFVGIIFLSTLSLRRATVSPDTSSTQCKLFLSTLSLRRATRWNSTERPVESHFYPRSPCGERQCNYSSLHPHKSFLSTLSLRRATTSALFSPLL